MSEKSQKVPVRRNPKTRKLEEVQQLLEQAKVSGDKFQQRVWQAVLDKLKNKPH